VIITPTLVIELLEQVTKLHIPFMVGGSFPSSAWGQPRQTNDLDIALLMTAQDAARLHEVTRGSFMGSEAGMLEALESKEPFASFQLLHFEETFKIDFFVLAPDEYVVGALARARPYEIAPGKPFPFTSPEDIVLTKLRWFELGNRISDKQWNDIVQILEIQRGHLDYSYLDKWSQWFGVVDLLHDALSQVVIDSES